MVELRAIEWPTYAFNALMNINKKACYNNENVCNYAIV